MATPPRTGGTSAIGGYATTGNAGSRWSRRCDKIAPRPQGRWMTPAPMRLQEACRSPSADVARMVMTAARVA